MSGAILTTPFNFRPVNTGRVNDTGTYTVPAGKYARVTVTISCSAFGIVRTQTQSNRDTYGDSKTTSFTIFMDAGEELSFYTNEATFTGGGPLVTGGYDFEDTSEVSCRIDGQAMAFLTTKGGGFGDSGGDNHFLEVVGTTEGTARFEEFNIPT